jgi:hypothetical protein
LKGSFHSAPGAGGARERLFARGSSKDEKIQNLQRQGDVKVPPVLFTTAAILFM